MIITKIHGGLGNQMFQYAAGKSLAVRNNAELKLDISYYKESDYRNYGLSFFNIQEDIASKEEIQKYKNTWRKIFNKILPPYQRSVITNFQHQYDQNILRLKDNKYLHGYWQNEKYFIDIANIIKKEFTPKNAINPQVQELLKSHPSKNIVSLHIRRGDYLSSNKFSRIYALLDLEYYTNAIEMIKTKVDNPVFFVFSDDIVWAEQNLSPFPCVFISKIGLTDHEELIMMSKCQHNIIANSSFSWWGAWLNNNPDKIIISPQKWFNDESISAKEITPNSWMSL